MRRIHVSALAIAVVASWLIASEVRSQGQNAPAVFAPTAGDYATADIRVITPGVVFAAGLPDIAAAFTKETGRKVGIVVVGMGTIVAEMTKKTPPPDVIVLPFQLMTTLSLDGGVVPGTFNPLGRNRMGLAVKAGAPHPDISTVEKFAAALKSAKAVMRSNPASRTMVAALKVSVGRDFPPFEKTHSRITLGTMDEMRQAVQVFKRVLTASSTSAGAR